MKKVKLLIRPILTVSAFILAYISITNSFTKAQDYARHIAFDIQRKCNQNTSCPEYLNGWNIRHDAYSFETMHGGIAKYTILYRTNGNFFEIAVRRNIDRGFSITGGKGRKLEEGSD